MCCVDSIKTVRDSGRKRSCKIFKQWWMASPGPAKRGSTKIRLTMQVRRSMPRRAAPRRIAPRRAAPCCAALCSTDVAGGPTGIPTAIGMDVPAREAGDREVREAARRWRHPHAARPRLPRRAPRKLRVQRGPPALREGLWLFPSLSPGPRLSYSPILLRPSSPPTLLWPSEHSPAPACLSHASCSHLPRCSAASAASDRPPLYMLRGHLPHSLPHSFPPSIPVVPTSL